MADACNITARAGHSKGYEVASGARIGGELKSVESDLPDNLKEEATLAFNAGVAEKMSISDLINKVQNNVLKKIDDIYKGQRYKGFIKFEYDTNIINITVNKFGGGNCQFSHSIGTMKSVCPDPFMGRLADPGRK